MTRAVRVGVKALVALVVSVAIAVAVLPGIVDRRMNTVVPTAMPDVSASAMALHKTLFVADMHADELLWGRDPLVRVDHGHVDVPRLVEGNVAIQIFSAVTKTPRNQNYDHNTDQTDNILLLALVQRWPMSTWRSLRARAMYQAGRLHDAAARSNGALTIVTSREQLAAFAAKRARNPTLVAGVLAIEGLHALDGTLESVDTLFAAGYRMMGLAHFFDNPVAASAHGVTHAGLTPFGRTVIARMDSLRIIVDLAHSSPQTIDDVLAMATRPMVVSHTGVAATCPGPRNLTDDQLRRIAAKGGLVGIGYWDAAVCTLGVESIVKAISHAVQIMGAQHVALGSDFDGATHTPFDTRDLSRITDGLMRAGMATDDIRRVMGANVLDFLNQALPER
jgi:microsomal dipeptidase-like Zn-dependent dipeptidase